MSDRFNLPDCLSAVESGPILSAVSKHYGMNRCLSNGVGLYLL